MKRKIMTERMDFKKLRQMCDFVVAHRDRIAKDSPAAEGVQALISTVTDLKALTAAQGSLGNKLRALSRATQEARAALREEVEFLYHTAASIAAKTPGFDDRFQMVLAGDSKLLNAARSAVEDAAPVAAAFIKHAMAPDFLDSLKASVGRLEQAREEHAKTRTARRLGGKALQQNLRHALAVGRGADAIMRNTFRTDPITLEAWKRACHLERAKPVKQKGGNTDADESNPSRSEIPPPALDRAQAEAEGAPESQARAEAEAAADAA